MIAEEAKISLASFFVHERHEKTQTYKLFGMNNMFFTPAR